MNKDQSYFLWTLAQGQLKHCLFPIGDYLKLEVRAIARKAGLPTADKKDSQGICFLGKVTLADFLRQYIPEKRGAVLLALSEVEGTTYKKVGEHPGAEFFTIGQRHGLNLGIKNQELGIRGKTITAAHYVAAKDVAKNVVVVAEGNEHPALYKREITLAHLNFVRPLEINGELSVHARVRYRQPLAKAVLHGGGETVTLVFEKPQKFVAAGQSAVFYSANGEMLGGGVIL